ncbi:MAG: hypothetical protein ACRCSF_08380 [Mycobacteriaceae bacterium]
MSFSKEKNIITILIISSALILTLSSCDSESSGSQQLSVKSFENQENTATTMRFDLREGKKISGTEIIDIVKGQIIFFEVVSDKQDALHIHGYDKHFEVLPKVVNKFNFIAEIPGTFEMELHSNDLLLAKLKVKG